MEYLVNDRNIVRDSVVTMTNVVASNAIERTDEAAKTGGGDVTLTGPYTGSADTVIDIKIVDTTITGVPAISAPVFGGVGNGTMTAVSATSGMSAETFTISLENLGTETKFARAQFHSAILEALTAGTPGNDIRITVDQSALVYSATDFALRDQLDASTNEYFGDHWNFGAQQLTPEGYIADNAPRVKFGDDPQIYRQYRIFTGAKFIYGFSPAPVRNVAAGSKVFAVSGDRTVTVTDGVTPEVYTGIETLYDALDAIRNSSLLVRVVTAIVNDRAPQGQAAMDLSVYTQSYAASIIRDGSPTVLAASLGLDVDEDAPTEILQITKGDGSDWNVIGDVSGSLAAAITGVLYSDGAYTFTIPNPPVDPNLVGEIFVEYSPVPRGEGEFTPQLCQELIRGRLGRDARNGVYEFQFATLPTAPCSCDDVTMDGGPDDDCLGTTEEPGGTNVSDANRLRRLQRGTTWVREFKRVNTRLFSAASNDLEFVDKAWDILRKCLTTLVTGTLDYPLFTISTVYAADKIIEPSPRNGYRYAVTTGGTSHTSAPTFPTTVGATVTDGAGVVYENIGVKSLTMWDDAFAELKADAYILAQLGSLHFAKEWVALTSIAGAEWYGGFMVPLTRNNHWYQATPATGTTGAAEPTYTTDGTTFADASVTWLDLGAYRASSFAYPAGSILAHPLYGIFRTKFGATRASPEPDFTASNEGGGYGIVLPANVTDGSVIWEFLGSTATPELITGLVTGGNLYATVDNTFYQRYEAVANDVLAAAGLEGNFDLPSTGDGCWAPEPDAVGAFFYIGSETPPYVEVYANKYYHSSKPMQTDEGELIYSTHEFGFGPALSCPESIKTGDLIRVTIKNVNGVNGGYQAGDRFTVFVTHGAPLEFGGGQTGDDTLTFTVVGTVSGRLDDYALNTVTPAAYSDGGIGFLITQGGVKFALGDEFTFALEGGHFQWRQDGGSWSADVAIAPTASLTAGLVANFAGGTPPSWVVADQWGFSARALNGGENLKSPTDARSQWNTSTAITIDPVTEDATRVAIYDHTIPSNAVIRVQGSDDSFSTTPLNQILTWASRNITAVIAGTSYAKYRITVDQPGSIQWLWLGTPLEAELARSGEREMGTMAKRRRMPSLTARRGLGVVVEHVMLDKSSADEICDAIESACELDSRRFGVVTNDGVPSLVQFDGEEIEQKDVFEFRPTDASKSLVSFNLQLSPVA